MTERQAIRATFAGFNKPVIGRKVVPLVFEVPIEEFRQAIEVLGTPDAANPAWCGIALLPKNSGPSPTLGPDKAEGDRALDAAPSAPKPNSTRAVMMAKDTEFRAWARVSSEALADEYIKARCGVTSKAHLNDGAPSRLFNDLRREFNSWRLSQ